MGDAAKMAIDPARLEEIRKAAYSRWQARQRWGIGHVPHGDDLSDWFAAENRINRYFYHSFPRIGKDTQAEIAKGLEIVQAMVDIGLVLTPELHTVTEQIPQGRSATVAVIQQRFCLTDLCPSEVPWHAMDFGAFSLEFETDTARWLGALPMFYFANNPDQLEGASWYGNSLLARIGYSLNTLLQRLRDLEARVHAAVPDQHAILETFPNGDQLDAITAANVLGLLLAFNNQLVYTAEELESALRTTSSLWGPTENLRYTPLMYYYRQREWRIIEGLHRPGCQTSPPTDAQAQALKAIDQGYFGKMLVHPQGQIERVRACTILRDLDGHHILSYVKRFIVPNQTVPATTAILQTVLQNPVVVPIESLW